MAPLLGRERHHRASITSRRLTPSHDDRRVLLHRHGYIDPERVWLVNIMIALPACWTGMFGNANAALKLPYHMARIIRFPEGRSELAKLRAEIQAVRHRVGWSNGI